MNWPLGKINKQSHWGASVGNIKVTDLVFDDETALFPKSVKALVMLLKALHEEVNPLGLKVLLACRSETPWMTVSSNNGLNIDIAVTENFTSLGSAVHNNGGSCLEITKWVGMAHSSMSSLNTSIWRSWYLLRWAKIRTFKMLVLPIFLHGWDMDTELWLA